MARSITREQVEEESHFEDEEKLIPFSSSTSPRPRPRPAPAPSPALQWFAENIETLTYPKLSVPPALLLRSQGERPTLPVVGAAKRGRDPEVQGRADLGHSSPSLRWPALIYMLRSQLRLLVLFPQSEFLG